MVQWLSFSTGILGSGAKQRVMGSKPSGVEQLLYGNVEMSSHPVCLSYGHFVQWYTNLREWLCLGKGPSAPGCQNMLGMEFAAHVT